MKIIPYLLLALLAACQVATEKDKQEVKKYAEKHRPQYHFTPGANWMNDPNGMFYYEGEYHLFYQYYPDSNVWGPMHWGHAVSKDMIRWEHLPVAIYPDELGYIFSGSAVVDWENTSGFGSKEEPPILAIYTYHDPEGERSGAIDFQYQGIAYSLDKGRSWTKYAKNPVLPNPGIKDFRDPKVMWHAPTQKWIMTLAVWDHVSFYSSSDLKTWEKESDFGLEWGSHGGVWECPDLFEMDVEGTDETRWVLLLSINPGGPQGGSATQYFVGDFDGTAFTLDEGFKPEVAPRPGSPIVERAVWIDYGADNYAGVTWSDIPDEDGRRLFIGWMSNWQYAQVVPTTVWRSAMTLPRALTLNQMNDSYRLYSEPVKEMAAYLGEPRSINGQLEETNFLLQAEVSGEFELTLSNALKESVTIKVVNMELEANKSIIPMLAFDRTSSGMTEFNDQFAKVHRVPLNEVNPETIQVYVDASSIEVFINNGQLVMSELVFPNEPYRDIETSGGITNVTHSAVRSIYQ